MKGIVKNISIQLRYAQYYTMIYNCTVGCREQKNLIMKTIFLSSMISHINDFVLGTNIWISFFK